LITIAQRIRNKIKKSDIHQFFRFCMVGSLNAIIDFSVLNVLLWLFPSQNIWCVLGYNSLAVLLASTNSFLCNKYWTFQQRHPITFQEVYRFVVLASGTILMNDILMWQLSRIFPDTIRNSLLESNILKLLAIIGTMSISFFGMRLWVFIQRTVRVNVKEDSASLSIPGIVPLSTRLASQKRLSPYRSIQTIPSRTSRDNRPEPQKILQSSAKIELPQGYCSVRKIRRVILQHI
jgi:putative flippase GtrA